MKIGDSVWIYQDPFTKQDCEGEARIHSLPVPTRDYDGEGLMLYRAKVVFSDEGIALTRIFSETVT